MLAELVPIAEGRTKYVGVMVQFKSGLDKAVFYAKYLCGIRWLFHGNFSSQDHWMVAETDAPPERLYRPDVSLLEWRRLVEEGNPFDPGPDGDSDEDLDEVKLWEDYDGDGHGRPDGETKMGCGRLPGWATTNKDCDDMKIGINPDAMEMCNEIDDNCNGRADEGALPTCGTGACRRQAPSCDRPEACVEGKPRDEVCNFIDDDCDGETDESDDGLECEGAGGAGGGRGDDDDDGSGGRGGKGDRDDDTAGGCAVGGGGAAGWLLIVMSVLLIGFRRRD